MTLYGRHWAVGFMVVGLLVAPPGMGGASTAPSGMVAVRTPGPPLTQLLAEGGDRSPTFRRLLRELEASGWIVFLQRGSCGVVAVSSCLLHTIGTFEGHRYLRVVLGDTSRSDDAMIATIGHELQHALEVVTEPAITQGIEIRQLFRRIGYVSRRSEHGEVFETIRALEVGTRILKELRANRRINRLGDTERRSTRRR